MKADLSAAALMLVEAEAIMRAGAQELLDTADDCEARDVADGLLRLDANTLTTFSRQLRAMGEIVDAMAKERAA